MTLRLHNTLAGKVETFIPQERGRVTFYSCGPTVYDFAHIGNFRSFLAADVLRRWLESPLCARVAPSGEQEALPGGYRVTQVMNITDVGHMTEDSAADGGGEDKMEAARKRLLEDKKSGRLPAGAPADLDPSNPYHIADYYADAFMHDARMLGLRVVEEAESRPELMPRPTHMVPEMLRMILALVRGGHAYIASDGVCYFDTQSFPPYGRLSGNTIEKIRSGAGGRVSENTQGIKKHPADFMLWKPDPTHLMRWDPQKELASEPDLAREAREIGLGEGYPGWHIECSVMARDRLGDVIDLHSGGEDNIFPHHECEIAQSCCATGRDVFSRYWFHPRFLMVEGEKMSKSKGNFFTVRDLAARGFSPAAIRMELIKTHYRSNANFTEQGLRDSTRIVDRWREFVRKGEESGVEGVRDEACAQVFSSATNDDLNIAGAIGAINAWINRTPSPSRADAALMREFDRVLGLLERDASGAPVAGPEDGALAARVEGLIQRRAAARAAKDWAEADAVRDELAAMNIVLIDSPEGTRWERKASL